VKYHTRFIVALDVNETYLNGGTAFPYAS